MATPFQSGPLAREGVIDPSLLSTLDPTIRAAQRGDEAAFATLYDAHAGRVFALCLRLSADRVLAEELVQDVFVCVWERLGSYRGESAFSTWLHRVAINTVLQNARKGARRRLRVQIAADFANIAVEPDGPTQVSDVHQQIDVDNAVASLPAGARAVWILYDVEGYGHAEIGALLGIAEGTSKAHLFRARRLLRERLER